jgi:hypothetical protein
MTHETFQDKIIEVSRIKAEAEALALKVGIAPAAAERIVRELLAAGVLEVKGDRFYRKGADKSWLNDGGPADGIWKPKVG